MPTVRPEDLGNESDVVITTKLGRVGVITMNDPDHLNPINTHPNGSEHQLAQAVLDMDRDDDIHAIVIHGAGRAFSVGADFRPPSLSVYGTDNQVRRGMAKYLDLDESRSWSMWYILDGCSKPLIAAVHGWAIGGGWEIAQWCDVIIADETAKFVCNQPDLGLNPTFEVDFLAKSCGRWKAAEIIYTGRTVAAAEAFQLNLVAEVVPTGTHVDRAIQVAELAAQKGQPVLAAIRRNLNRATLQTADWEMTRRDFSLLRLTEAHQNAVREWQSRRGKVRNH